MPYFGYLGGLDLIGIAIMLISLIITTAAQLKVKSAFSKYSQIRSQRGMTARDAVYYILRYNGCSDVRVEHISGSLTDHYDPKAQVIRLSDATDNSMSIAAIGVAAHEAGHAAQYHEDYFPMKVRALIIPISNIGSSLSWLVLIIGLAFSFPTLCYIGVGLFFFAVLFQLLTLPVELNASRRALNTLSSTNILTEEEIKGARKVLTAAAMTYVAALATSILQLLRMLLIANRSRRR
ncbi:MAG: zinc metallopeptidase [Clostridia bacterium]|nr:zinc metallopeptidase [Clostridia bacterium]